MANGYNRVVCFGNLTRDAEMRMSSSGSAITKFSVACNERYKTSDGSWTDRAEFVNCVLFGKRAESLAQYLTKGSAVMIDGKLRTSSWDDKDGNKRYKTEVIVDNVVLAGRGSGQGSGQQSGGYGDDGGDYGDSDDTDIPF